MVRRAADVTPEKKARWKRKKVHPAFAKIQNPIRRIGRNSSAWRRYRFARVKIGFSVRKQDVFCGIYSDVKREGKKQYKKMPVR
jgi:hypothetical protein